MWASDSGCGRQKIPTSLFAPGPVTKNVKMEMEPANNWVKFRLHRIGAVRVSVLVDTCASTGCKGGGGGASTPPALTADPEKS